MNDNGRMSVFHTNDNRVPQGFTWRTRVFYAGSHPRDKEAWSSTGLRFLRGLQTGKNAGRRVIVDSITVTTGPKTASTVHEGVQVVAMDTAAEGRYHVAWIERERPPSKWPKWYRRERGLPA